MSPERWLFPSTLKLALSSRSILPSEALVKELLPRLGAGMYFSSFVDGSDQALGGMLAFGKTHWDGDVQPGV
jgi:hypothetical protein